MNATDLMIGDWVSYHGENLKIDEFNYKYAYFVDNHPLNGILVDELEPVPLTAEILDKTGFSRYEDPDEIVKHIYVMEKCEVVENNKGQFYWVVLDTDAAIAQLNYVHELQRAMWFCKVQEEVVL